MTQRRDGATTHTSFSAVKALLPDVQVTRRAMALVVTLALVMGMVPLRALAEDWADAPEAPVTAGEAAASEAQAQPVAQESSQGAQADDVAAPDQQPAEEDAAAAPVAGEPDEDAAATPAQADEAGSKQDAAKADAKASSAEEGAAMTAQADEAQTHAINVVNGSADMLEAQAGETVTLTAEPPAGHPTATFVEWRLSNGETGSTKSLSFTMPDEDVTAIACYKDWVDEAKDSSFVNLVGLLTLTDTARDEVEELFRQSSTLSVDFETSVSNLPTIFRVHLSTLRLLLETQAELYIGSDPVETIVTNENRAWNNVETVTETFNMNGDPVEDGGSFDEATPALIVNTNRGDFGKEFTLTIRLNINYASHSNLNIGTTEGGGFTMEAIKNGEVDNEGSETGVYAITNKSDVTLVATPEEGYEFDGWYEGVVGSSSFIEDHTDKLISSDATYAFVINEDVNIRAVFKEASATEDEISYYVASGDGSTYTLGEGTDLEFVFKRNIDDAEAFEHFTGILVDGETVDSGNYTAESGSVVVTLKAAYLETLAVGDHTLTAVFDDGNDPDASFTVKAADEPEDDTEDPDDDPDDDGEDPDDGAIPSRDGRTSGNKPRPAAPHRVLAKTGDTVAQGTVTLLAALGTALIILGVRQRSRRRDS